MSRSSGARSGEGRRSGMNRCVIVGGADIGCRERILREIRKDDFFIFCDSGLKHLSWMGVDPGLIVGDFDSHPRPETETETIVLPREKDDTDTVYAAKEALRRGYEDFLLLGVIGARLDHTLGNVSLLLFLDSQGKSARILDDYSDMEIVSRKTAFVEDSFSFFSLLNVSGTARGITIRNARYPLTEGEITCDYQYGVSNEVLKGKTAEISLREGRLLLIRDY